MIFAFVVVGIIIGSYVSVVSIPFVVVIACIVRVVLPVCIACVVRISHFALFTPVICQVVIRWAV